MSAIRAGLLQRLVVNPAQIQSSILMLTADQQHYLYRVLRLQAGDRFIAMDGNGQTWLAVLQPTPTAETCTAELIEPISTPTELPLAVTLVIALPKGNALDEVVRQATELGVSCIAPVISDRTLLHPSPQKLDRWRRIAQEAAEQSERQRVPTLLDPIPFADHLATLPSQTQTQQCYIGVTRRAAPDLLTRLLATGDRLDAPITLAIGCEGGWTETEVEQAIAAGYQPISLGARILRTVTAPIVALSLIAAIAEQGTVKQ